MENLSRSCRKEWSWENLAETQKLYDSYNASTSVYTRVGTLMRLYGYQESLWSYLEAKNARDSYLSSDELSHTSALMLFSSGRWEDFREAMEAIDQAIVLSPTLPDLWNTKIDFLLCSP